MVIGKIFSKLVQAIPSWEMTKYYGRVCVFQLRCIKYRIQTSEAWFNFRCKFMPASIQAEKSKVEKTKTDGCEPQTRLNESCKTDEQQMATKVQSENRIWLPKKSSQSKDPEKRNEKK